MARNISETQEWAGIYRGSKAVAYLDPGMEAPGTNLTIVGFSDEQDKWILKDEAGTEYLLKVEEFVLLPYEPAYYEERRAFHALSVSGPITSVLAHNSDEAFMMIHLALSKRGRERALQAWIANDYAIRLPAMEA